MGTGRRLGVPARAVLTVMLVISAGACSTTNVTARADSARVTTTTTLPTTSTTTATTPATPPSPTALLPLTGPEPSSASTTGCAEALAYLATHQAPGFVDTCADGSAFGHLGVTCADAAGMCPGTRFIHIACPAPFVYMNEAHNSWALTGTGSGIDPYGQGTAAERAACAPHR